MDEAAVALVGGKLAAASATKGAMSLVRAGVPFVSAATSFAFGGYDMFKGISDAVSNGGGIEIADAIDKAVEDINKLREDLKHVINMRNKICGLR
jgi:hypothetical protein